MTTLKLTRSTKDLIHERFKAGVSMDALAIWTWMLFEGEIPLMSCLDQVESIILKKVKG